MFSDKRKKRTLSVVLSAAAIVLVWVGLAGPALAQGDTTRPAAVDDVRVVSLFDDGTLRSHNSITIGWTATADDGKFSNSGPASKYDIRYSTMPIDDNNFTNATALLCTPTPRSPGELESVTLGGLSSDTTY